MGAMKVDLYPTLVVSWSALDSQVGSGSEAHQNPWKRYSMSKTRALYGSRL